MAGLWHLNESPRSIVDMLWKLFIVLVLLLQLGAADQIKNRLQRVNNDVRAPKIGKELDDARIRAERDASTYENVAGIPSRSSHAHKQRSNTPGEPKKPVIKVDEGFTQVAEEKQLEGRFSSVNSANALATLQPPVPVPKAPTIFGREPFELSTTDNLKLENLVIFVTINGTIHARTRDTGKEIWTLSTSPLFESKRHKERIRSPTLSRNSDDDMEWVVGAVEGGQLYWYSEESGLQKLSLSIKEFVDLTPCRVGNNVYIGEKKTELYKLDPRSGKLLFPLFPGDTDKSCRRVGLEGLDDDECPKKKIILGKTEYTITIHVEDEPLWTIKYVEWGPGNQDLDLGAKYEVPLDHKYFMVSHDGTIHVRDVSKIGRKDLLHYKFDTAAVRGFDVVSKGSESYNDDEGLVLLPQPSDRIDQGNNEKCHIQHLDGAGFYAMCETTYPGIISGGEEVVGSGVRRIEAGPSWNTMDDGARRAHLIGVHNLVKAPQGLPKNPPLTLPATESEPVQKSGWMRNHAVEMLLGVQLVIALAYILQRNLSSPKQKTPEIISAVEGPVEESVAEPASEPAIEPTMEPIVDREVTEITGDIPILKAPSQSEDLAPAEVKGEVLEPPRVEVPQVELPKVDVVEPLDETIPDGAETPQPPSTPRAEPTVRFVEPETTTEKEEKENSDKPEGKKKSKTRRGTRGGTKRKAKREGSQDQKDLAAVTGSDDLQNGTGLPEVKTIITTPEKLEDEDDGKLPGDLVVTDQVLGYGSHGTTVFRGTFEGKDVAVKRMLLSFYDVASHEVALLQESDDHPNVVRYYCKQQKGQFLYIALELCPASLYDITDHPNNFDYIVQHMHPPDVLYQITLGVQHLHSLKIVHRDIKPQNILVTAPKPSVRDPNKITPPRLLISDFGLCKKLEPDQSSFRATTAHAAGTTGWRAPELLATEEGAPPLISTTEGSTTGSTSDGAILATLTNRRATRAIDIFSLGCVFYYVLTKGQHPFGDRYMREANIIYGNQNMSHLDILGDAGLEAKDLISRMIRRNPKQRPDAATVLMHPFFWSAEKKLTFLLDVSDRFEVEERDPPSPLLMKLEENAADVLGTDWLKRLDKVFIDNLGKYRKYNGTKMLDLLRALRNKKHHYQDLPANVKASLGDLPDGFLQYFTSRFPRLIMHAYYVVRESELRYESSFRNIFDPI